MLPKCVRIPDSMFVSSEDLMGLPAHIEYVMPGQLCLEGLAIDGGQQVLLE